ncbi:MAG: type III-B CRISPR-associated protein Cas10/Cmr2 [Verrucomicrobia bacterium]|nr:type III-B CRISPR-associated protein Cas10/Cmr2 [Verrucomicrobiota bacterium]
MSELWKRKLLAFLHDPPHKPFRIAGHEDARESFLREVGLTLDDMRHHFVRMDDHMAAAADRFVFPHPELSGVRSDWRESGFAFHHPLAGTSLSLSEFPATPEAAETMMTRALQRVGAKEGQDWKRKFPLVWRLWPELCARETGQLNFLVADTRIPDHTLWQHNGLVSALANCEQGVSFLLFQIGPVQDFIKQARKTQDLWAGSFLLSYLIAQAMLAIAREIGPDAIIYPQLRGVPLADWFWHNQGILPSKLRASHENELLTPNLPNRFLAVIPKGWRKDAKPDGKTLPEIAEESVRTEWSRIAKAVRDDIVEELKQTDGHFPDWDMFWDEQVARFPIVDYVVHDWLGPEQAIKQAEELATPPLKDGWKNHPLRHAVQWAREMILPEHRDARCYKRKSWKEGTEWKSLLLDANGQPLALGAMPVFDNAGLVWALNYALTDWKFAAAKNARAFATWDGANRQLERGVPKDHLDGRSEVLGGPTQGLAEDNPDNPNNRFWAVLREAYGGEERGKFKGKQKYGALNVIKRLSNLWMMKILKCMPPEFESVIDVAIAREEGEAAKEKEPTYYAVLAMDGDDMGQWVSGVKAPPLLTSLAGDESDEKSPKGYFKKYWDTSNSAGLPPFKSVRRVLTPGFHVALSEALSNFGLYCVKSIVEHDEFHGRLLFSGGDDVLAMLPAETALDCAQALTLAFRGDKKAIESLPEDNRVRRVLLNLFEFPTPGFVCCQEHASSEEHHRPNWPLMVMGPESTASVGIAIGHVRTPMQDTIQAARDAEHAAKSVPGKGAFCVSILKRCGESARFAAKWSSGVAGVWAELSSGHLDQSGRFAYRYLQLIRPLLGSTDKNNDDGWEKQWTSDLKGSVEAELRHVLKKQANQDQADATSNAGRWIGALIGENLNEPALSPRNFIHFWMAWAFVNRIHQPTEQP